MKLHNLNTNILIKIYEHNNSESSGPASRLSPLQISRHCERIEHNQAGDFEENDEDEAPEIKILTEDLHPSNGSPPDRERELNAIKLEILKIEEQIRLQSSKETEVRTVPPDLGLKKSTRKQGTVPRRRKWKELKLCGENEIIRNQKKAMSRMFLSGK